jgi:hypothetical protein
MSRYGMARRQWSKLHSRPGQQQANTQAEPCREPWHSGSKIDKASRANMS